MFENKQKSQMTKWILAFVIFFFTVLGTYVSVFSLIGFAVFAYIIVFCDSKIALFVIVFSMSFANIFKTSPTAQSLFTYVILGYVAYNLIMGRSFTDEFFLMFTLMIVFLSAQFLMSVNILRTIKFVVNFMFVYFALYDAIENEKDIFGGYILGVICASAIAWLDIVPHLDQYVDRSFVLVDKESVSRFSGLYPDPNYYSVNVIIALCLTVILHYKREIKIVTFVLVSLILFGCVVLTFSKSAFLMLIIPVSLFLYTNKKFGRYGVQAICLMVLLAFVIYALLGKIEFVSTVLSRIQNSNNLAQLTTGRSNIWKNYITNFSKSFFYVCVGRGLGAGYVKGKAAHNTYIDMVHYLGLFGSFLMLRLLYVTKKDFEIKVFRRVYLNYIIIIVIMVMYFFLSELFYFDMPFHFLLAIIVFNMDFEN